MAATQDAETRRAALVSRKTLSTHQPVIQRALAVAVWGVSLTGSLLWAGGGWGMWAALAPSWPWVGVALGGQLAASALQWVFARHHGPYYLLSLAASTGTSIAGYWPLVHPPLSMWIQTHDGALWHVGGPYLAGVLIIIVCLFCDVFPETVLTSE